MTRFARAKGSKASNEKAPEDATPWEVMKQQLLQAKQENEDVKNRQAAEQQRIENYEKFLKDRRVQKRPATWCDFPEAEKQSQNTSRNNIEEKVVKKKKKKNKSSTNVFNAEDNSEEISNVELLNCTSIKKIKRKNKQLEDTVKSSEHKDDVSKNSGPPQKKRRQNSHVLVKEPQSNVKDSFESGAVSSQKKRNKKRKTAHLADNSIENNDTDPKNYDYMKQNQKNKLKSNAGVANAQMDVQESNTLFNKQNKQKSKKKKKLVDGKPVRRKEISDKSFQLILGGKEVELVRFDGFPVTKKDAERLAELKDSMIKKGIPKSEVQRTMKLERRRAEKALARMKRDVCYNCRKGGHNLSDCPELKSKIPGADAPEGVCFKCGSTEHRQFECKVQRDKEFRFATCFICKEAGHIARQCPDNPKGLYPNGGSCKLCGDVTHLRKDCPTASSKKEDTSVKLQTLDSTDDIEGIGLQNKSTISSDFTKKPKKIKF